MKKLKLNLHDLKVESFETSTKIPHKGTVNGNLPPGETVPVNNCEGGGGGGSMTGACSCVGYTCGYSQCPQMCVTHTCESGCGTCWWECDYS